MQIRDVQRGTCQLGVMLFFVSLALIPRTAVILECPEGLILEVAILFFENIHIKHQTRN